jgi:hypothetical protein
MKRMGIPPMRPLRTIAGFVLATTVAVACGESDHEAPDGSAGKASAGAAGRGGSSGSGGAHAGSSSGGNAARAGNTVTAGKGGGSTGGASGASNPNRGGSSSGVGGDAGTTSAGGRGASGDNAVGGAGQNGMSGDDSGGSTAGGAAGDNAGGEVNSCTTPVDMPLPGNCGILGTILLQYQADESTSTLSFSVRLTTGDLSNEAVRIDQIEVHYYLSLEENSGFHATVDSFVQHAPDIDYTSTAEISFVKLEPAQAATSAAGGACQTHFIRIRNTSPAELASYDGGAGPYLEFHVTLTPNDASAPNQSHVDDLSYRPDPATFHENLGMAVFVCGHQVDGCSPGDAGPC